MKRHAVPERNVAKRPPDCRRSRLGDRLRLAALAVALSCGVASVHAAPPKESTAFGAALGATPDAASKALRSQYAPCAPTRSIYHELPADKTPYAASVAINPGLTFNDIGAADLCAYSPAGEGITDGVEVRFVHPSIDAAQPVYQIEGRRLYPDVVYARPATLRNTFEAIRRGLFALYGKPLEERRDRVASSAANLAASLGIGKDVKREDYLVQYLWAEKGRLGDVDQEGVPCDCKGRYVKAALEISRAPTTIPKNTFYVLSVTITVDDPDLRRRQEAWNAQWQTVSATR